MKRKVKRKQGPGVPQVILIIFGIHQNHLYYHIILNAQKKKSFHFDFEYDSESRPQ